MITSLNKSDLREYISRQLNYFYPDNDIIDLKNYERAITLALDRLEYCYKPCTLKHYNNGENTFFNHLYSDHYVMYLWFLANTIWKESSDKTTCNKLYYLNKSLNGLDCMYDTNLPDIFLIFHGVGTMLGKASYSDYFVVLQGCTVGMSNGKYPSIGKGVSLTAHSSLIGNCKVGDNVTISSYTNIIDKDIPAGTVAFRNDNGAMEIKKSNNTYAKNFFIVS